MIAFNRLAHSRTVRVCERALAALVQARCPAAQRSPLTSRVPNTAFTSSPSLHSRRISAARAPRVMQTAKMHDGHELVPHPLKKGQILMVCTSSAGDDGSKTGAWLAEFAVPYYAFKEAGYDVTLASTHGGDIPLDKTSLHPLKDAAAQRFLDDDEAQVQLRHSVPLSSVAAPTEYDCVYLAGGHGAMWDMPEDTKLQDILQRAWAAGNIVATVCHGPAGLVGAVDEDGKPLVAGKKMTCFSDAEEAAMGLLGKSSPFKLQTKLQELGADVSPGLPMTSCVHRDGQLITGQNPVSLQKLTEEVIKALNERRNNVSSPAK